MLLLLGFFCCNIYRLSSAVTEIIDTDLLQFEKGVTSLPHTVTSFEGNSCDAKQKTDKPQPTCLL